MIGAITCLEGLRGKVDFTIYGPIEDQRYWEKCEELLAKLPSNIQTAYKGDIPSSKVQETLQKHDVFLFPTKGENYGHVIFEALSVGCIPIISDQTPWSIIAEKKAGFVLPLTRDMRYFQLAIEKIIKMPENVEIQMSKNAVSIARSKLNEAKTQTSYRKIFSLEK